jgi:hypothetical protein
MVLAPRWRARISPISAGQACSVWARSSPSVPQSHPRPPHVRIPTDVPGRRGRYVSLDVRLNFTSTCELHTRLHNGCIMVACGERGGTATYKTD